MTLIHIDILPLVISIFYMLTISLCLLWLGGVGKSLGELRQRALYQAIIFGGSGFSLVLAHVMHRPYTGLGNLLTLAHPNPFLGIGKHETWLSLWLNVGLIIAGVTALFMWLSYRNRAPVRSKSVLPLIPVVILLAMTNAFAEEVFYRLVPIWLLGNFTPVFAIGLSALGFGIVHYWGVPQGFFGVIMAAFLSYMASVSIFETGGWLWAWGLHTILDIIIFSRLIIYKTHLSP